MSKNRKKKKMSTTGRPPILPPKSRGTTARSHDTRISQAMATKSQVNTLKTSAKTVAILPLDTGEGDQLLKLLFRPSFDGAFTVYPEVLERDVSGSVDLLTTGLGGIVDSVPLTADTDYLIWGFASGETDLEFQGYGLTRRPQTLTAATFSGGGYGVSAVFAMSAGEPWLFTIGARVIVRQSTAINADYNQGVITDTSQGTITVTMDADYALTEQNNQSLIGLFNLEIIQTDGFQPKFVDAAAVSDPGAYGGYQYTYLGMLQTNGTSDIRWTRRHCEWYSMPERPQIVQDATLVVPIMAYVGCGRTVPVGVRDLWISSIITMINQAVHLEVHVGYDPARQHMYMQSGFSNSASLSGHTWQYASETPLIEMTASIYTNRNLIHGECYYDMYIERYRPLDW